MANEEEKTFSHAKSKDCPKSQDGPPVGEKKGMVVFTGRGVLWWLFDPVCLFSYGLSRASRTDRDGVYVLRRSVAVELKDESSELDIESQLSKFAEK